MAGTAEKVEADGVAQQKKKARPGVATVLAAVVLLAVLLAHFYYGFSGLFDLGILGSGLAPPFIGEGALTEAGGQLFADGFQLALGVAALFIVVGLLLRRRGAWIAAMTWVAVSLALSLVRHFSGEPVYLRMLANVVLMLVLNQAPVHRAFGVQRRQDEPSG